MFREYRYAFGEVCPSMEVLKRYLQTPDKEGYALVEDTIRKTFQVLEDTPEIVGGYRIVECREIDNREGNILCPEGILHTGRRISSYMNGASQLALFICTAGERFTQLSHAYQQNGDFLEAFVVDSIGSATVENAMEHIQHSLAGEMEAAGHKVTNRYSPGYCDWPLAEQQVLFASIGNHSTGITLNSSCLMQPVKSVSGIIGIGMNVRKRPYGCSICSSKTCVYRRIITGE